MIVANPESIVDGKATTDTILYWVWNDGENLYTYDPDGDEISSYNISGINEYVTGNVTLGGEVVGFATHITEAGPHECIYYVTDSEGNTSNVVSLSPTTPKARNIDKNRQKRYNRSARKKTKS